MLDLQKYLSKAADDPGFKKRLIENANQAIKDEFGEDLPCKLKCREKLVFEVERMDELADSDLVGVAGGGLGLKKKIKTAKEWMKQFKSDPQYTYSQPGSSNLSSNPATNTSSEPRNPARAVYGADPSTRYW